MWAVFAVGSAVFAALTSVLAKIGVEKIDSNLATAVRTFVVLIFSWGIVFATGAQRGLASISRRSLLFLILSGLATGASWLCYYRAIQLGDVAKVVPIDKFSLVITVALAFFLLHEAISPALYVTPQPQDSIFLDICTAVGYNRNIKGAATSGWPEQKM